MNRETKDAMMAAALALEMEGDGMMSGWKAGQLVRDMISDSSPREREMRRMLMELRDGLEDHGWVARKIDLILELR